MLRIVGAPCDAKDIDLVTPVSHEASRHGLAEGLKPLVYFEIAGNLPSRRCISQATQ